MNSEIEITAASSTGNARCQQRGVIWPAFWTIWSLVFGAFAITCWVIGEGTPTLMAWATGMHMMGFINSLTRWVEAI